MSALLPYTASSLAVFEGDLRAHVRFPSPSNQHFFDARHGRGTNFQPSFGPTGVSLGSVLSGEPQEGAGTAAKGLALMLQHLAAVCAAAGDHGTSHTSAMRADSDYPPVFYPSTDREGLIPMPSEHAFTLMYLKLTSARERLLLQVEGYNMLSVMETNVSSAQVTSPLASSQQPYPHPSLSTPHPPQSPDYLRYSAALGRLVFCDIFLNLLTPGTEAVAPQLEELGFLFTGILPAGRQGDWLVLQYFNGVVVDYDSIDVEEPATQQLLDYIRANDIATA